MEEKLHGPITLMHHPTTNLRENPKKYNPLASIITNPSPADERSIASSVAWEKM